MSPLRIVGVVLIALGLFALAYRGFSYTTREKVVDLGPVEVTRDDREYVSLPPILGGAAVVIGIALLFVGRRQA
jgi:hypothetical protein